MKKVYCIENNRDRFPFDAMKKLGFEEFWCPPTQRLAIPRMYKTASMPVAVPEFGGTYDQANPSQTFAMIARQINDRIPDKNADVLVILDIEWSPPLTRAGRNYIEDVRNYIRTLRPNATVAIYDNPAGSDVLDAVAASLYVGKPVLMFGSQGDRWPTSYLDAVIDGQLAMLRPDRKRVALVNPFYQQKGPHQGKVVGEYETGMIVRKCLAAKVDTIGIWSAFNPSNDPASNWTLDYQIRGIVNLAATIARFLDAGNEIGVP